jgi:hypothetical protein
MARLVWLALAAPRNNSPMKRISIRRIYFQQLGWAAKILILVVTMASASANASDPEFGQLYDSYFPRSLGSLRKDFDSILFGPRCAVHGMTNREFRDAFYDDANSFHSFLHTPDRNSEGYNGVVWNYECCILLFRLGDQRFAELLRREDRSTRVAVGYALEQKIDFLNDRFPRTRVLYRYRQPSALKEKLGQEIRFGSRGGRKSRVVLKHYAPASSSKMFPDCGLPQSGGIQHLTFEQSRGYEENRAGGRT